MKALELDAEKNLAIKDFKIPIPSENEVLVKLKASALNHREIWIGKGLYPGMQLPCILGADGAGIVEQVGAAVTDISMGSEVVIYPALDWGSDEGAPSRSFRVLGMPENGTIAEYISVPKDNIFRKPKNLSFEESAAFPLASLTAWRALKEYGAIDASKNILITGIGGGVAQAGFAIAKALGCNIYVTSGSTNKIQDAIDNGAKGGVSYKEENWNLKLKDLCGGIDVVLDSSPDPQLDNYLRFLNRGAKIVYYGSTGARSTTMNMSKFFLRHIQFIGTAMGSPLDFKNLISFIDDHDIKPRIAKTFDLDDAVSAIKYLEKGEQIGKVVIRH